MSDPNTEQRLASLERFARAITRRQAGEDQLQEGVTRLSDETNALNTILNKVDEQQQQLAQLNTRTNLVEKTAVSRQELIGATEAQGAEAFEFRKQTLRRIYFTGLIMALTLLVGGYAFYEYNKYNKEEDIRICGERNEQYDILLDILNGVVSDMPDDSERSKSINEGIRRLENQLVECEGIS